MAMIDPPPLVTNTKAPKYEFIEGHLYCDGIKVMPWQLTEDEVSKYVPKSFQSTYLKSTTRLPIPNKPDKA